jgi:hypothetical protein
VGADSSTTTNPTGPGPETSSSTTIVGSVITF